MEQYLKLCSKTLAEGIRKQNRTGVAHFGYTGDMMKFDLSKGFPAVTTKKLAFKSVVAEMLGFLRGYDNAADFRKLGCKVWDANANENKQWLESNYREGVDDLGRIYGVQARSWEIDKTWNLDQLRMVYDDLRKGKDNRREIVTHWNPGELDKMALPPCHMFYQFGIQGDRLNLSMYQRSCDVPLGIPFNIAGYAWLLSVMAHITGLRAGEFTHFMHDIHIYENQIDLMYEQVVRKPLPLPTLRITEKIKTLEDLETWVTVDDFELVGYQHHPPIKFPFAV
jgi:thymidylate synthase